MNLRKLALMLGFFTLLTGTAWSQTFRTQRPAYVFEEPISFTLEGVPAEQDIDIYSYFQADDTPAPTGNDFGWQGGIQSNSLGEVKGRMPAPENEDGRSGTYIFEARNPRNGSYLARAQVRVVPISVTPAWDARGVIGNLDLVATGFFSANDLFMHYVRQPGGGHPDQLLKTVRLGPIDPNTGGLSRTIVPFPFSPVPGGDYLIQFDGYQVYEDRRDRPASPELPYVVYSTRVPGR